MDAREIFSGRMPTRILPPRAVGAEHRPAGSRSVLPPTPTRMSVPDSVISPSMRLEVPRKLATKVVFGFSYRSAGAPSCSTRPAFITATVSAMVMASS